MKAVEVVDDHTVRLRLAQRFAPLTALLADRSGMILSPKAIDKYGDKFGTHPVCVGPFKFKERVASDRIVLERAPDYYDADRVSLKQITFKVITEGPVRASNLRSGDVDVAERLEPVDVVSIKGDDSIDLQERTSLGYQSIVLNVGNDKGVGKPFKTVDLPLAKHPELREAFEDSLDREVINKVVFFDQNVPGCSPISPVSELGRGREVPRPRPGEGEAAGEGERRQDADPAEADRVRRLAGDPPRRGRAGDGQGGGLRGQAAADRVHDRPGPRHRG